MGLKLTADFKQPQDHQHPVVILLFSRWVVCNSATSWTGARQALLSMGLPRQKYWSGLQFPSPGPLPNLVIDQISYLASGFFTTKLPRKLSRPIFKEKIVTSHVYRFFGVTATSLFRKIKEFEWRIFSPSEKQTHQVLTALVKILCWRGNQLWEKK